MGSIGLLVPESANWKPFGRAIGANPGIGGPQPVGVPVFSSPMPFAD